MDDILSRQSHEGEQNERVLNQHRHGNGGCDSNENQQQQEHDVEQYILEQQQALPKLLPRHHIPLNQALHIINEHLESVAIQHVKEAHDVSNAMQNNSTTPSRRRPPKSPLKALVDSYNYTYNPSSSSPSSSSGSMSTNFVLPNSGADNDILFPPPLPGELQLPFNQQLTLKRLLDAAVGIVCYGANHHQNAASASTFIGITATAHSGLLCLPVYIVRGAEYERVARYHNWTEMQVSRMHLLSNNFATAGWETSNVHRYKEAVDYLTRASLVNRNLFARRALHWLTRYKPKYFERSELESPAQFRFEFIQAIQCKHRQKAIRLGRLIVKVDDPAPSETPLVPKMRRTGESDIMVRPDATFCIGMKPRQQKAMSANNIGYLLQHGSINNGITIEPDIEEAIVYYEIAVAWGNYIAAGNLGFIHHSHFGNFEKALKLYELAIEKGERNFTPRNLALLLMEKKFASQDYVYAAKCLLLGVQGGDAACKLKCVRTLNRVCRSWKFKLNATAQLKRQCASVLQQQKVHSHINTKMVRASY